MKGVRLLKYVLFTGREATIFRLFVKADDKLLRAAHRVATVEALVAGSIADSD